MADKIVMIALSPTMNEGKILRWNIKEGDKISSGDTLCEVETDKAAMDYESSQDGVILKITAQEGTLTKVGETIAIIGKAGETFAHLLSTNLNAKALVPPVRSEPASTTLTAQRAPDEPSKPALSSHPSGRVFASPLARKIAAAKAIDLQTVQGSGPRGRIVQRDLEFTAQNKSSTVSKPATQMAFSTDESPRIPLSMMRKTIAKRLSESMFTAPHYYLKTSVDFGPLLAARKRTLSKERPIAPSLNAFVMKILAGALRNHPIVNASWDDDALIMNHSIDIGIAVALPGGLITPIVRNVANKGILQIEDELKELISRAQKGTLTPEEYRGATFTLSNLGSFGIEEFTAIINPPGSAILALGAVNKTATVDDNDQIVIKSIAKLTLSCDHRVIDGADGARFMGEVKAMFEDPFRVLLY